MMRAEHHSRLPLGNGHEGLVKIPLGHEEVSPNNLDEDCRTPLLHAAKCEHERVVKILLGREEVNPDRLGDNGRALASRFAWT